MSDSTTQQKKSNKVAASVASSAKDEASDALSAFERELQKKIRNKMKKLEKIQELETKIKRKEIVANEEQLGKVAAKASVQAEIDDVRSYLTMYSDSQKEGGGEAALKKQHAKELYKSKE
jgi:peptidyl-tRNA hydrolase